VEILQPPLSRYYSLSWYIAMELKTRSGSARDSALFAI